MTTRRWLGVAVTVTSAAIAVLGVGSGALASNTAGTGQIKACYKSSGTLPPLAHIASTATCPTGNTTLTWNKVGPRGLQGPAGVSVGTSGTSGTQVLLNQPQTLTQVLSAATIPASGTYYVNASVMLVVGQSDTVACILGVNGGATGAFATVGPVPNQSYETIPLSGMMSLASGQVPQVLCAGYNGNSNTSFYDGSMTSVLINSATGTSTAKPHSPLHFHRNPPPHL